MGDLWDLGTAVFLGDLLFDYDSKSCSWNYCWVPSSLGWSSLGEKVGSTSPWVPWLPLQSTILKWVFWAFCKVLISLMGIKQSYGWLMGWVGFLPTLLNLFPFFFLWTTLGKNGELFWFATDIMLSWKRLSSAKVFMPAFSNWFWSK